MTLIPGSNKTKACSQLTFKNPGEQTRSQQGASCIKLLDRTFSRSHTQAFRQTGGEHATGTTDCGPRQIERTGKKPTVPLPEKQEGTPWRPGRCSETRCRRAVTTRLPDDLGLGWRQRLQAARQLRAQASKRKSGREEARESKGARGDPGAGAVGWDGRMGLSGVTGDARARATTRGGARMGAAWWCGAAASRGAPRVGGRVLRCAPSLSGTRGRRPPIAAGARSTGGARGHSSPHRHRRRASSGASCRLALALAPGGGRQAALGLGRSHVASKIDASDPITPRPRPPAPAPISSTIPPFCGFRRVAAQRWRDASTSRRRDETV